MSLFEWLGESINPGPVGNIEAGESSLEPRKMKRIWVILLSVLCVLLFAFINWCINRADSSATRWGLRIGFIVYLVIASQITPKPDSSNMGFLGGLIDHPFRISDDINRFLLLFYILLLQGKMIIFPFRALSTLSKNNR